MSMTVYPQLSALRGGVYGAVVPNPASAGSAFSPRHRSREMSDVFSSSDSECAHCVWAKKKKRKVPRLTSRSRMRCQCQKESCCARAHALIECLRSLHGLPKGHDERVGVSVYQCLSGGIEIPCSGSILVHMDARQGVWESDIDNSNGKGTSTKRVVRKKSL